MRTFVLLALCLTVNAALAEDAERHAWVEAADPAVLGWSAEKLDASEAFARSLQTESVMIVDKSGVIVRQWGPVDRGSRCCW